MSSRLLRSALVPLLAALTWASLLWGGYQLAFSTLALYDDEGYLLVSLNAYRAGAALYDDVYSQYGPAYYVLQAAWHDVWQVPVTHDVARWRLLTLWGASAGLAGWCVARMTGSPVWGGLALVLVFLHLDRLALEPGHPQEWCLVLLLLSWWQVTRSARANPDRPSPSPSLGPALLLGVLTGTVGMIKPNLGVFLGLGTCVAIAGELPPGRWQRGLRLTWLALLLALPWVLMRAQLAQAANWPLPFLISAAVLLVALRQSCQVPVTTWTWRQLAAYLLGAAATGVAFASAAGASGTSLGGLYRGLIGQHAAFGSLAFFHPAPLPGWALPAVALSALLCGVARRWPRAGRVAAATLACLPLGLLWQQLADSGQPLLHGTLDRGGCAAAAVLATCGSWLILRPAARHDWAPTCSPDTGFARRWLAYVAPAQLLGAYPVPGTQMAVGSVLLLGLLLVVACDATRPSPLSAGLARYLSPRRLVAATLILAVVTVGVRDYVTWQRRASYVPLSLPGAARLRLPREMVDETRWLTRQLQAHGDTFVFREHTRNSYYLWAGLAPPTDLNATCWPYLLSAEQQHRILHTLQGRDRIAVVTEPYAAPLPRDRSPLLQHLDQHFAPVTAGRYYRLGVLRDTDG